MPDYSWPLNPVDPLPWLLEESNPAVRHLALVQLLDRPHDDPEVVAAQRAAMESDPIAAMLAAQHPDGWWEKPGPGYSPKYTATVWQVIFLEQLGADPHDAAVIRACDYVLEHSQTESGGFGASGSATAQRPPASIAIHCLHGNLLRALIGFGWLEDPRVQRAIDWGARSITGEGEITYYRSGTTGPLFACVANGGLPCSWGAVKALSGLARVPKERRSDAVERALAVGADFLLSRDPAVADYPIGSDAKAPSSSWFKLGFPSGYVADVLQNLDVLCELGHGADTRLDGALEWLLAQRNGDGVWVNRYAYNDKTTVDIEPQGAPSKGVTLRACRVLKAVAAARTASPERVLVPA